MDVNRPVGATAHTFKHADSSDAMKWSRGPIGERMIDRPGSTWRVESALLAACGAWLVGLGLYFIFVRPALLPEDFRYVGITQQALIQAAPGLQRWLQRVFTVMGGFMLGTGVLTLCLVRAMPQRPMRIGLWLAGFLTVGLMSAVNFMIGSDFRWILLVPALVWLAALSMASRRYHPSGHALD